MSEKPIIQQFQEDLDAVVDKYRDEGLTTGEAIGTIELVKMNLWYESEEGF